MALPPIWGFPPPRQRLTAWKSNARRDGENESVLRRIMVDADICVTDEYLDYMRGWSKLYLSRVRSCIHTIRMIESEIAELDESIDGLKGIDPSAGRSRGQASDDAMVNRIARIESLREEYQAELDANLQAQADAHRALKHVRQPWRAVLTYRYLEGMTWADVAAALKGSDGEPYNIDHVRKDMHDNGLIELFPYIPHEYDDFPEAI